jgi:hypothetical protein
VGHGAVCHRLWRLRRLTIGDGLGAHAVLGGDLVGHVWSC